MMWISVLFFLAIITTAVSLNLESFTFDFTKGFYFLDLPSLMIVLPVALLFGISVPSFLDKRHLGPRYLAIINSSYTLLFLRTFSNWHQNSQENISKRCRCYMQRQTNPARHKVSIYIVTYKAYNISYKINVNFTLWNELYDIVSTKNPLLWK